MGNEGAGTGKARISPVDEAQLLRAAACDWRLARGDVGVYAVILKHADADGLAYPGTRLIAEQARLAATNVKISIRKLERLGYFRVNRPGPRKRHEYRLQDAPTCPPSAPARMTSGFKPSAPARMTRSEKASAPVDMHPSAPVDVRNLVMPARPESSSEITSESSCAARAFSSKGEKQQREQVSREKQICDDYIQAKGSDPVLTRIMEREYWGILKRHGLIEEGRLPTLAA